MQTRNQWRQAITLSVFIHVLLLIGIGWFSVFAHPSPIQQDYIEMELLNDTSSASFSSQPSFLSSDTAANEIQPLKTVQNITAPDSGAATVSVAPANNFAVDNSAGIGNNSVSQAEMATSADTGIQAKPILLAPRILQKIDPIYPEQARREGWEGNVKVRFQVLTDGKTDNISIESSSGSAVLDDAAISALQQWKFIPAKNQTTNQPISCWTYVTLVFRLNNAAR